MRLAFTDGKEESWYVRVLPKLTEAEQDLLWQMEHGYQLETDSLGGNPVLRRLKDDEVIRRLLPVDCGFFVEY